MPSERENGKLMALRVRCRCRCRRRRVAAVAVPVVRGAATRIRLQRGRWCVTSA